MDVVATSYCNIRRCLTDAEKGMCLASSSNPFLCSKRIRCRDSFVIEQPI